MFALAALVFNLITRPPPPKTVLITLDGVMWQDIYATDGWRSVPHLYDDFLREGIAVGKSTPIIASGPNHISLPGYLEITRGHPSTDCQRNDCDPVIDRSILTAFQHPAVFSSWGTIRKTLPSYPMYADIGDGYRWDPDTIRATNIYLDHNTPDFLWVSLGDTDEVAHANERHKYFEALHLADDFIHSLVVRYPSTTFIITTDHGRNWNFRDHGKEKASERVWLMMRGPYVPHKGLVSAPLLRLSNIYPTIVDSHSPDSILTKIQ